jgi:hypothetical protein
MLKLPPNILLLWCICNGTFGHVCGRTADEEFPKYQAVEQEQHIVERHGAFDDLLDSLSQQPVLSDLDASKVFEERLAQIEENRERIRTWHGAARSSFWVRRRAELLQEVVYRFEIDSDCDAEKAFTDVMAIDRHGKPNVFSKLFCMRMANDIYTMGPWSNLAQGRQTLTIRHGGFSSAYDSGNFSPWCYFGWDHRPFAERMNTSLQNVKLGHSRIKVQCTERHVRIDRHTINQKGLEIWVFDLAQGGNLCRSVIQSPEDTAWVQAEFESCEGAWVPKKHHFVMTHRTEKMKDADRSHLIVFDNHVNDELPKDAFELSGLGLGEAFEVWDRRTGEKFEYRKTSSDKEENGGRTQTAFASPSNESSKKRPEHDNSPNPAENRVSGGRVETGNRLNRVLELGVLFLGIACIAYTIICRYKRKIR